MSGPMAALDVETFARTALRFAAKRRALPPEAAETLTGEIMRHLAGADAAVRPGADAGAGAAPGAIPGTGPGPEEVTAERLAEFCAVLVQPAPEAALAYLRARQAEGVGQTAFYLGYIAGAARALGAGWDNNELSMTEVTIGTGHLYALMRALRAEAPMPRGGGDARKRALFATVPGEDHGLGVTVAADLFRKAGWEVDLQLATDHAALIERARARAPRVMGLSLSTEARLGALARLVVALRLALPGMVIAVAPAATLDATRVEALLDVDLVLGDAVSARAALERLVAPEG